MPTLSLLLALLPAAQTPEKDARRLKPLLPPPPPEVHADPAGAEASTAPEGPPVDDGVGPRPLPTHLKSPFEHDRPLLEVDGARIMASELNALVQYYRSFKQGSTEMLLMDAVAALLEAKVVEARYGYEFPEMRERLQEMLRARDGGFGWAELVRTFSDDSESEDPEGRYTFGRERAVQPFDMAAFTLEPGPQGSTVVVTKYGFHLIEALDYERGPTPADDLATMRHVLVMFPGLRRMRDGGGDIRAWIREQLDAARIKVLWDGHENLVPPERRAQILR